MTAFDDLPFQLDQNVVDMIQQDYIKMQQNEDDILKNDPHDIVTTVVKSLTQMLDFETDPVILHDVLVKNVALLCLVIERLY